MFKPMTYVTQREDMPTGAHFAILVFSHVYVPGDERSRTNPGHGYPEHTEPVTRYIAFADEASWREAIAIRMKKHPHEEFVALRAQPARVEVRYDVSVEVK